jgi:hypothetical protein
MRDLVQGSRAELWWNLLFTIITNAQKSADISSQNARSTEKKNIFDQCLQLILTPTFQQVQQNSTPSKVSLNEQQKQYTTKLAIVLIHD